MDNKSAKKCVKDNINAYKLQRTNEILTKHNLHNNLYNSMVFFSQIGALEPYSLPRIIIVLSTGVKATVVLHDYLKHDLNDEIEYLKNIKSDLSVGINNYENIEREEFEKTLAKRRTAFHK